jgi:hypothetical protein
MTADHWHYINDVHGGAEQHHQHYDLENLCEGLRARIRDLEDRLYALECEIPKTEATP